MIQLQIFLGLRSKNEKRRSWYFYARSKVVSHLCFIDIVYSSEGLKNQGAGATATVADADAAKLALRGA